MSLAIKRYLEVLDCLVPVASVLAIHKIDGFRVLFRPSDEIQFSRWRILYGVRATQLDKAVAAEQVRNESNRAFRRHDKDRNRTEREAADDTGHCQILIKEKNEPLRSLFATIHGLTRLDTKFRVVDRVKLCTERRNESCPTMLVDITR